MRLTTGLATSTSSGHDTPAQKSIANAKPTNTMPVPRSGCFMMSAHGMPTTSAGFQSSSSDRGGSLNVESTLASASTTVIFASSDGCPMRKPPMASQLLELAAVPAPLPMNSSKQEHGDRDAIHRPREPIQQSHRASAHGVRRDEGDQKPHELIAPQLGDTREDVRLSRGIHDGDAVERKQQRDRDERPVDRKAARRHQPSTDRSTMGVTCRYAAMIFDAICAARVPWPPNSIITATTMDGLSAGAKPTNQA